MAKEIFYYLQPINNCFRRMFNTLVQKQLDNMINDQTHYIKNYPDSKPTLKDVKSSGGMRSMRIEMSHGISGL